MIKKIVFMIFISIMMFSLNLNQVYASDLSNGQESSQIEFTQEELDFIKEHPTIKLGIDPDFMPYEFIDSDGEYKGIAADYIQLLSEKINIKMIIEPDMTWAKAYEMGVEKKVDVLPCVSKTEEREQYFIFSDPYFTVQRVIVVQEDVENIDGVDDLKGETVAVQKNSSHYSYLKEIPEITLSLYTTPEDALIAVSKGEEKIFVGNLATSAYIIKANGITGLKFISFETEAEALQLHFAVRNDWPVLASIINKGLASITTEEKMEITDKWIGIENEIDYRKIVTIVIVSAGMILIIVVISFFWIKRLKKEIAKRVVLEKELWKAKIEADNANHIKSTFLARMSHEIRTPLNAITGMSYLMKKSGLNLQQKMYIDKINEAAHTTLDVINDILDFSKIEAGKIELENKAFDLDKVIQRVISIVSFRIEEQGILFCFKKDPQIPKNFIGDAKRIEQILLNLLSNAVKFTKNGTVSLCLIQKKQDENVVFLEFAVKDTGIGMTKDQIDQLFKPFVQADSSINRRFGGTGLGLSIVKSFVELMQGEIIVDSVEGKGSVFTVILPMVLDETINCEYEAERTTAFIYLQEVKTLALIKETSLSGILETYLVNWGIHAEFTKTPENAKQFLLEGQGDGRVPYGLLILDYDVLGDSCFEFARNILIMSEIRVKPRIIMLLPMMHEELYEKVEMYELDLGIMKPIIPSVLFDGIMEIFHKKDLESSINNQMLGRADEIKTQRNYNVLVVDDNKTNQFIAKSILEQVGVQVMLADNGEEGVSIYLANADKINLILMDLHMPVLNGYEASVRIRETDKMVPIIAMTADAITGVEEQCRSVGIYHYISKPFEPEKFIDIILEILNHQDILQRKNNVESNEMFMESGENNLKSEEQSYLGLDIEDALRLVGGNREIYHMVLKEFCKENEKTAKIIEDEINTSNYKEAAQLVHKVKGSSGNTGAKQLYEIAGFLQKALESESEENIQKYYPLFCEFFEKSLGEIRKFVKNL